MTHDPEFNGPRLAQRVDDALLAVATRMSAGPRGLRSASFTRYVIDEEPSLQLDAELRDAIVAIETSFARN